MEENRSASSGASAKRTIAVTAAAVAVAAVLAGGVTYSYLVGASEEVENTFETNADPVVEVVETTGTDYEIVPGTSEKKDPYVYVTTTTDYSYVFLIVQDNTYGLVDYEIADGWTELYVYVDDDDDSDGNDTDDEGNAYYYTKIYYRVVADTEGESVGLQVLKDDTVSYDEDITGDGMVDVLGNALNVTLSFGAVAIQCDDFDDVYDAFAAAYSSYTAAPLAFVYTVEPYEITLYDKTTTLTPDVIYVFEATESSTTAALSYYADWYAEFVVTIDTSEADDEGLENWNGNVAIAGQYDYYSQYWLPIVLEFDTDSDEDTATYYLMKDSVKYTLNYLFLCSYVNVFTCGTIQTYNDYGIDVPDGVTITVELRLYESYDKSASSYSDTYVTIGSWTYTYGSDSDDEEADDTSTEDSSTSDSATE